MSSISDLDLSTLTGDEFTELAQRVNKEQARRQTQELKTVIDKCIAEKGYYLVFDGLTKLEDYSEYQ